MSEICRLLCSYIYLITSAGITLGGFFFNGIWDLKIKSYKAEMEAPEEDVGKL